METSISQNNTPPQDWHRADIVAALRKAGWSLRRLSRYHGYEAGSLGQALKRPWPRAERLIAEAIGVSPEAIWPTRYARRAQHTTGRDSGRNDQM